MLRTTGTGGVGSPSDDSALRGATLAFRASPSPSNKNVSVPASTYGGALAAASRAGSVNAATSWKPSVNTVRLDPSQTGDSSITAGRAALNRSYSQTDGTSSSTPASIYRETSPSYIAATRAASRSRSTAVRNGPLNDSNQRRRSVQQISVAQTSREGLDETSIPSTSRLVELFEAKQRSEAPSPITVAKEPELRKQDNIISPTPIRPSLSLRIRAPTIPAEVLPEPVKLASPPRNDPIIATDLDKGRPIFRNAQSSAEMTNTISNSSPRRDMLSPKLPASSMRIQQDLGQNATRSRPKPDEDVLQVPSNSFPTPTQETQRQSSKLPPKPPPPRRARPASVGPRSEVDSVVRTASTPPILPRRFTQIPPAQLKPQLTADSLANAMVASSLASSRAPSPSHSQPPEPLFRQHNSKHHSMASLFLLHSPTHTPSPPKLLPSKPQGMRQTLRPSPASSEDESTNKHRHQQHKHGFLIKKHPNKHAEGDRRHWRDSITEPERKRYEGVWAANRGVLISYESALDPTTEQDEVHGFVVRDIFSRSGLGDRVLGEIWDLVEGGGHAYRERQTQMQTQTQTQGSRRSIIATTARKGRLKRHEFVVGLWLVDQCLKGRKLPVEVQSSVWDSAKGLMSGLRTR